jgi:transcriptional regulator with XRE-family HTH domain
MTKLRAARLARKMTQRDLAALLGDRLDTSVHNWETGKARPRPKHRQRLALIFGVPAEELLSPENEAAATSATTS